MAVTNITVVHGSVVLPSAGARLQAVQWGEAVDKGEAVYLNSSNGKYYLATANGSGASGLAEATCRGFALVGGSTDAYGTLLRSGPIDFGTSILTAKASYHLSPHTSAGNIRMDTTDNLADLGTGDFLVHVGRATSARILEVDIHVHTTAV